MNEKKTQDPIIKNQGLLIYHAWYCDKIHPDTIRQIVKPYHQ